jgi:hypothetical protein
MPLIHTSLAQAVSFLNGAARERKKFKEAKMAQGEFTKQEAVETEKALKEVMEAFPKKQFMEFVGHFNDIFLFIAAAKKAAPEEKK